MLTKFKSLAKEIGDLGGTYDDKEMQMDFWHTAKTMEEKKWSRYVNDQHNTYRELPKATPTKILDLVFDLKRNKQILRMMRNGISFLKRMPKFWHLPHSF